MATPEAVPTVAALAEVARIMRQHTHWRQYAMTRQAGPDPEHDCHLCRALVKAGVLALDEIGAGTLAAFAATPTPAPEASGVHAHPYDPSCRESMIAGTLRGECLSAPEADRG